MKKALLFMTAIGMACYSWAQPTIGKYYSASGSYRFNLIEMSSHNLLTDMSYSNTVNVGGISLLNSDGSQIYSHNYAVDSILLLQSIRKYSDNELYLITIYEGSASCYVQNQLVQHLGPVIGRMDSLGHVSNLKRYVLNAGCQNVAGDLEVMHDKCVITWGREQSFFALKADSNLAHVWSKHFDRHGGFQFIKELPGGDLLAGINMDTAGAVVARLDADGNFLWCKSYIRPGGMVHDALIESDSSFIITGYTDSIQLNMFLPLPTSFHPKLFMLKLDGQGEVQWCKGYDSAPDLWYTPQWSRIEKTQDGNYVVLATLGYPENNFFHRPFLMKTDLNGDTLWTRSRGIASQDYFTRDLLVCSDGGLMFSGSVWGDVPGNSLGVSYIFKTDSLGHFDCNELHYPIEVSDLFPTDSSFTLNSVDGATTYPAYVQDTTYDAIQVYNACNTVGVPNLYNQGRNKPRVRPNPSTGHFTVEFTDPLTVDSFYSVYDATGRLLFQRPLTKSMEKVEVDLTGYGKGMYLIRFSDRDGACSERVVVE